MSTLRLCGHHPRVEVDGRQLKDGLEVAVAVQRVELI